MGIPAFRQMLFRLFPKDYYNRLQNNVLSRRYTNTRVFVRSRLLATLTPALLLIYLLCSCTAFPTPAKVASIPTPIVAQHQPYRTIRVCLDATLSYPYTYLNAAKQELADAIYQTVQPDSEGMDVYVGWIFKSSFDADALVIHVAPVPPDPQRRLSSSTGNLYSDAQKKADIEVAYYKALMENHNYLAKVRADTKQNTNKLRVLAPHGDAHGTSIYGCIAHGSWQLQNAKGERYLFIASDMEENQYNEDISSISLKGVKVRMIYYYCSNAQGCQDKKAFWSQQFAKWGTTDVQFFDFEQTQLIGNLFS